VLFMPKNGLENLPVNKRMNLRHLRKLTVSSISGDGIEDNENRIQCKDIYVAKKFHISEFFSGNSKLSEYIALDINSTSNM